MGRGQRHGEPVAEREYIASKGPAFIAEKGPTQDAEADQQTLTHPAEGNTFPGGTY
jgi:hypothetical protein